MATRQRRSAATPGGAVRGAYWQPRAGDSVAPDRVPALIRILASRDGDDVLLLLAGYCRRARTAQRPNEPPRCQGRLQQLTQLTAKRPRQRAAAKESGPGPAGVRVNLAGKPRSSSGVRWPGGAGLSAGPQAGGFLGGCWRCQARPLGSLSAVCPSVRNRCSAPQRG
jgi:hypothetical protein